MRIGVVRLEADSLLQTRDGLVQVSLGHKGVAEVAVSLGVFRPQAMLPVAFSKKYNNSPMPHSIFFTGSYAIHGSYEVGHLGRPASHGCVRLAPANAATLFAMVKKEGAVITITGSPPGSGVVVASSGKHHAKPIVVAKHHHHGGQVTALGYAPQPQAKPLKLWLENPVAP